VTLLKLIATMVRVLQQAGVRDPAQRLLMIRSWQTTTLLVRNSPVTTVNIARLARVSAMPRASISYGIQAWLRRKPISITSCRSLGFTMGARAPLLGTHSAGFCGRVSLRHSAGDRRPALLPEFFPLVFTRRGLEVKRVAAAWRCSKWVTWCWLLRPSSQALAAGIALVVLPLLVLRTPEAGASRLS